MSSRCLHLLEKCRSLTQLKQAHALAVTCGLATNTFALSRILAFCSNPSHGALDYGYKIFNQIENPTICICNTMIKGFLLKDESFRALQVHRLILRHGLLPDNYTLPYTLKACANMKSLNLGGSVHGQSLKLGFPSDNFVGNSLIAMYSAVGEMGAARLVFEEISLKCVVSWTVLISGYAKGGDVYSARLVFDEAPLKDRGIWGAMIAGYVQNNCFKEGLKLFRLMQLSGIKPDEASLVSMLCACAHLGCLEIGKWIHRYVEKVGMSLGLKLGTALIDMYSKCGCLDLAEKVFDEMHKRDVICWNTMISGYAMNGDGGSAVKMFDEMRRLGVEPDSVTFISLFMACSYSNMAEEGLRLLHEMADVCKIEPGPEHYGCIVDLLTRARLIEEANAIVQRMPVTGSSSEEAIAWRALLSGCCSHGRVDLAEAAAERLVELERHSGAYVLLANAYAAAGRHEEARRIRKMMRKRGVEKTPGCSSVEIDSSVHEFVAGEKTHSRMDEISAILEVIKKHLEIDSSFVSSVSL
ncbi:pentatricopeptide repeat-containing protein At2g20540-like [Salvia hispanica]|uniref:pentatricopeptide repeat-containing protein At2g20540-like n=1 Tax=Salvia hispanica TaxID=49212 RepID=UPI002009A85E|nr:pentatricopeptide repeat-containing protein At2g20540-like [Salvia hispanica]